MNTEELKRVLQSATDQQWKDAHTEATRLTQRAKIESCSFEDSYRTGVERLELDRLPPEAKPGYIIEITDNHPRVNGKWTFYQKEGEKFVFIREPKEPSDFMNNTASISDETTPKGDPIIEAFWGESEFVISSHYSGEITLSKSEAERLRDALDDFIGLPTA